MQLAYSYPGTYQAADAAALQPVAALANGDLSVLNFIPGGWQIISRIYGNASGCQALLVTNTLPSDPSQTFAVLALGQTWSALLTNFPGGQTPLGTGFPLWTLGAVFGGPVTPPPYPPPPTTPLFSMAYQQLYTQAEALLFAALKQPAIQQAVNNLPLIVIGQAQAAGLAQLGALAFRATRTGLPSGLSLATAACYTFATPPLGDTNFDTLLQQQVPAAFNVYATTANATPIDFFATPSTTMSGAVRCGQAQAVTGLIPTPDDPWVEHSGMFYTTLLGGTPHGINAPGAVQSPPTTFSADLAYTLTQLCAVAYQQAQHSGLAPAPVVSGYTLSPMIASGGTRWAAVFYNASNNVVVVAFRGATYFDESVTALTQLGSDMYPSFLQNYAAVPIGVNVIYSGLRDSLRSTVQSLLNAAPAGATVVITGHDIGGSLANLAALDFAENASSGGIPVPTAIYTFGSPPSGDYVFQSAFSQYFGNTSSPASFQIIRPGDPFPLLSRVYGGYLTMPLALTLTGATIYDDAINHSLTSYAQLLNPS